MEPFKITTHKGKQLPILISVPHCGTSFPDEIKDQYKAELIKNPDDTDWFVDRLYDFAPDLGMTMISAVYSRWVIDLNRDPQSKPLYTDGRIITGLCPTTNFLGNTLYNDARTDVDKFEMQRRLDLYYWPYHHKIATLLEDLRATFGYAILWDCHSIRQYVRTIQTEKFPDLILGSEDEQSASKLIIDAALVKLKSSALTVNHNHPFKGGFITRKFGQPSNNTHALQLEMTKVNYMDDSELYYDEVKAEKIRSVLKSTLLDLSQVVF